MNLLVLTFITLIYFCNNAKLTINSVKHTSIFFNPNAWQKTIESISEITAQLINDIILVKNNQRYFPVISIVFNFILFSNLIGLVPYTFTSTSHIIVTFTLSFSIFIGITIMTFEKYKLQAFSLFLPANTSFFLALILVPIEFISYIARLISLGMRLFINLMAGHSLLKVVIGFAWSMLLLENLNSFGMIIPIIVVIVLFGLELGVALIQTYVFIILTCIYVYENQ